MLTLSQIFVNYFKNNSNTIIFAIKIINNEKFTFKY